MINKPVCVFQSGLFTRSGYGDWSFEIAKSLIKYDKFDVKFVPTPWGACSKRELDNSDPMTREIVGRVLTTNLTRQPEVFIQSTIPSEFITPAKFNIGLTAFIETTLPRPEWIEKMNSMNLNIVLSKFNKEVASNTAYNKNLPNGIVEELKLKIPIETLFWGADTSKYFKTNEKNDSLEESMKNIPETFCFLFVGQWTAGNMRADRKGIGFLIKTFLETFANTSNPPALILKTSGAQICIMDRHDCINKINDVTNMVKSALPVGSKLPNVYLLHGELNDKEMNSLFNHEKVKIHTSFSHGESWGHPGLLSTLTGKPVLYPNWSGHIDYLNPKYCKYFEGSLVNVPDEAHNDWFIKDSKWFDVDYTAAGQKMKYYYNNYNGKILENAEALRIENMEKFSLESMNKEFHSMLDKYVPKFAVEQPIILPKLKRLNLPSVTHNNKEVEIKSPDIALNKETSDTTLTKI